MVVDEIHKKFDNITKEYDSIIESIEEVWLPSATEEEEIHFLKSVLHFLNKIEDRFSMEFLDSRIRIEKSNEKKYEE